MLAPPRLDPALPPLSRLLEAMGGGERIRSVRSFVSETVRVHRRGDGDMTPPLQASAPDDLGAAERVLTHRAAGGFVRIETFPLRETGRVRDPVRPAEQAKVYAHALKIRGDEIDKLLREVSLEPRNLLAHAHERALAVHAANGGGIEIEDLRENALYVFDPRTFLCAVRRDGRLGATTHYLDWRIIAGIATPFFEIQDTGGRVCESRLVGVAYDLPLPASLFTH